MTKLNKCSNIEKKGDSDVHTKSGHLSVFPFLIFVRGRIWREIMSKKCDECKRCAMNDDMTNVVMSSADWQRSEQRHLRREKRFVAIIVLLILLLVGSNVGWMIYENQFEVVEETTETIITQDNSGGYNNYIGNDSDIVNGETDNKN